MARSAAASGAQLRRGARRVAAGPARTTANTPGRTGDKRERRARANSTRAMSSGVPRPGSATRAVSAVTSAEEYTTRKPLRWSSSSAAASGSPAEMPHALPCEQRAENQQRAERTPFVNQPALAERCSMITFCAVAVPGEIGGCENQAQGFERLEIFDRALELHLAQVSAVEALGVNRHETGLALEPAPGTAATSHRPV